MTASGTLLLRGGGGAVELTVVGGGIAVVGDSITVSIESRVVPPHDWPPVASFCMDGAQLPPGGLRAGLRLHSDFSARQQELASSQLPKVHAYFTFHAVDVVLTLHFLAVTEAGASVRLEATSEDVDYYDERAQQAVWSGECTLPFQPLAKLWVPK